MTSPLESPLPASLRWSEGELLGWRVWRLARWGRNGSLRLCSGAHPTIWPGPVMTADQEPTADPSDRHGLYGLKPNVRSSGSEFDRLWAIVSGWVALSGTVIEHEHGYRASRAVIRRLRLGACAHLLSRSLASSRQSATNWNDVTSARSSSETSSDVLPTPQSAAGTLV